MTAMWRQHVHGAWPAVAAALAVMVVVLAALLLRPDDPWSPLGPFPVQEVSDVDKVVDVAEGAVMVTGTKCRGATSVQVQGTLAWRRVEPPGFATEPLTFAAAVQPAECRTQQFTNPIPDAVVDDVCTFGSSIWHINGVETPLGEVVERVPQLDSDGVQVVDELGVPQFIETVQARSGLPLGWETENFTLICDGEAASTMGAVGGSTP